MAETENEIATELDEGGNLIMSGDVTTLTEFYIDEVGNLIWNPSDDEAGSPDGLPIVRTQFVDEITGTRTDIHVRTCATAVKCANGYTLQENLDAILASITKLGGAV